MVRAIWWKPEHVGYFVIRLWIWLELLFCVASSDIALAGKGWGQKRGDLLTSEELWEWVSPLGLQGHLPCFPVALKIPRVWSGISGDSPESPCGGGAACLLMAQEGPGYCPCWGGSHLPTGPARTPLGRGLHGGSGCSLESLGVQAPFWPFPGGRRQESSVMLE